MLTAILLVSAGLANYTTNDSTALVNTSEDESKEDISGDVAKLANETRNFVLDTLRNMTEYLPINIVYAETVGRNCNIIKYNKDYYSAPGLVIAALLFLIGVLFCFLGKHPGSVFSSLLSSMWVAHALV